MTGIKNTMLTDEQLETLQNLEWPEQLVLLGSSAGIDSSIWKLEVIGKSGFAQIKRYVERLSAKSRTANPFFEPAFLEPEPRALLVAPRGAISGRRDRHGAARFYARGDWGFGR
ncbi:MAG: hypothetical protein AAGA76_10720, partial [Pseudomonadota bacterium]